MPGKQSVSCFIDTNIWLYAFIQTDDSAKHFTASRLLQKAEPVLSTQVINEICANLIRKVDLSEKKISQLVRSFYEKYQIIEFNKSILLTASGLREKYSLSFWDSLIVASALSVPVSVLYSEDLQHGLKISKRLQVLNPFVEIQ